MENSAKALYMAGTLLISLLVVSLLVYAFNNLGGVQDQKDKIEQEAELTKFNREYEAFNKRLMYGVDVISCINKAVSNNEKYMNKGKWASAGASGEETLIQVMVRLNSKLKESYQIYYINEKGKESKVFNTDKNLIDEIKKSFKDDTFQTKFSNGKKVTYTTIGDQEIQNIIAKNGPSKEFEQEMENIYKDNKYFYMYLLKPDNKDGNFDINSAKKEYTEFSDEFTSLYKLSSNANDIELYAYNKVQTKNTWSSIKWTTALADFKRRKFGCDKIEYNENTGKVEKIVFVEK